jgi:trans-aconitate methyltransferase
MTDAGLPAEAGMVLAMGSLQYTADPEAAIAHLAGWLRPGGVLAVLVDSLVGLVWSCCATAASRRPCSA